MMDLKPCPFCGGINIKLRETGREVEAWEAFCMGSKERACDAAMWGETKERAAEEWNRRDTDLLEAQAALIAEAREALRPFNEMHSFAETPEGDGVCIISEATVKRARAVAAKLDNA